MKCEWCYKGLKYRTKFCCKECESYYEKLYSIYKQIDELD